MIVEDTGLHAADETVARARLVLCYLLVAQLAELIDNDTEDDVQQDDQHDNEEENIEKEARSELVHVRRHRRVTELAAHVVSDAAAGQQTVVHDLREAQQHIGALVAPPIHHIALWRTAESGVHRGL